MNRRRLLALAAAAPLPLAACLGDPGGDAGAGGPTETATDAGTATTRDTATGTPTRTPPLSNEGLPELLVSNDTADPVRVRLSFTPEGEDDPTFTDAVDLSAGGDREYADVEAIDGPGRFDVAAGDGRAARYEYVGGSGTVVVRVEASGVPVYLVTA